MLDDRTWSKSQLPAARRMSNLPMVKYNLRLQNTIATMAGQVVGATAAAALAQANAANAQAVAQAVEKVNFFMPAAPPKYGNKKKDADTRQWLCNGWTS
jgi:hypothetical protein